MKINTNAWNKIRYSIYAPIYPFLIKVVAERTRAKSFELLAARADEKILVVGGGTGADFPFLKNLKNVTAVDLTPDMVERMKLQREKLDANIEVLEMDGQQLQFPNETFDCVILHFIVAVIPDAEKCLCEAARVLKPGGRVVVADKFLLTGEKAGWLRKLIEPIATLLFTTVNRNLSDLAAAANLKIKTVTAAPNANKLLRVALLEK
ncbi:MAG: class I SAM-dependent methyltransferase [Prevotellaceae bacterium]|jgi:ubiquinone/menaquinone biosynthesis C-methylase UbiE|nr:class I SAM-dependent methyltransferase [Prevotellaceae bacterium]